ncbi:aminotransferase class I/II-fold pyridoxal phosphate-dependent enzyme [Roseivirga sp. BDSF3-8]|uniref:aminotransferase class I/II-fold pyridoxal phosphate-dependent enzyme n=1 Tax=Roseivirga sp. BDSF3-8 TaxID=3241598 RepID=UPI0035325F8E
MAQALDTLNDIINDATRRGVAHNFTEDEQLSGARVTVNGQELVNFGSCSYLGLEFHSALKQGVIDAVNKYGTQFSTSRTYLAVGLYKELEEELFNIFHKPLLVTATTTLGHLAALPTIVGDDDAVIMDLQVHSSIQMTAQMLKARKIPLYVVPNNSMEALENKVKLLQNRHRKIWFLTDGVFSMYGNTPPMDKLVSLLDRYKQLHLYIDDAHGMSWMGKNGQGYVHTVVPHHEKMVVVISMTKGFACAGGVVIFPNEEMRDRVKNCGGTLIFAGPVQPPLLGAAVASAKLHQTEEFARLQADLQNKIAYINRRLVELNLPLYEASDAPVFFVSAGLPRITYNIVNRMKRRGYHINSAAFPAVPMKKSGIRFMVNVMHSYEDIEGMLLALQEEYVLGLQEEGSSFEEVARVFRLPAFTIQVEKSIKEVVSQETTGLREEKYRSVASLPVAEWNYYMAEGGCHTHSNLLNLERGFSGHGQKENNASFYYHKVTDEKGGIVSLAFFTYNIAKDDMFASAAVSARAEEIRRTEDPYYLVSGQVMTGTPFSLGRSVYLNKEHPAWKEALQRLLDNMQQVADAEGATRLMLRDFFEDDRNGLKEVLLDLGMIDYRLPGRCVVENLSWNTQEEYLASLGGKYRYNVRKEILPYADRFRVSYHKPATEAERQHGYALYRQVADKALQMNAFPLPYEVFTMMYDDPAYDIIQLYTDDREEAVALLFSYHNGEDYTGLAVGLDYTCIRTHNTYKQILYRSVLRARELGCVRNDLAYTAELEKKKVGATVRANYAFVQATEHLSHAIMETLS